MHCFGLNVIPEASYTSAMLKYTFNNSLEYFSHHNFTVRFTYVVSDPFFPLGFPPVNNKKNQFFSSCKYHFEKASKLQAEWYLVCCAGNCRCDRQINRWCNNCWFTQRCLPGRPCLHHPEPEIHSGGFHAQQAATSGELTPPPPPSNTHT